MTRSYWASTLLGVLALGCSSGSAQTFGEAAGGSQSPTTGGSVSLGGSAAGFDSRGGSEIGLGGAAGGQVSVQGGVPGATLGGRAGAGSGGAEAVAQVCESFATARVTGQLFAESFGISGVVASRKQPNVLWIHSDRQKILYAVDPEGRLLGQWELTSGARGFRIYNWEDISIQSMAEGPDRIWVGDIGNNFVRGGGDPRTSIRLLSVEEPQVDPESVVSGTAAVLDDLELTYPDGLHDSEAMSIDPLTGDIYVFAKEEQAPSKAYRVRPPYQSGELEYVATLDDYWLNGASFSPSGRELLLRNYTEVTYWALSAGKTWAEALASPPDRQQRLSFTDGYYGEAIGFSADESGFYVVQEQDEGMPASPVEFYAKDCQ